VITVRALAALLAAALLLPAAADAFPGTNGTLAVQGGSSAQGRLVLRKANGKALATITTSGRPSKPVFSAAGVRIAYVSGGRIWVAQADGTFQRVLTPGYHDTDPAWSPLGDTIAYSAGPSGGRDIWSIGTDGNNLRRLTASDDDDVTPTYDKRGDLAFVRITAPGDGDIWRIDAVTGRKRHLTRGPFDDRDPTWSPDARRLAFTRVVGTHRDIYIANSLGHHVRRIRSLPGKAGSPVFSPDGRWIAFAMAKPGKRPGVWEMRTNGKGLHQIVAPWIRARSLDWSPVPGDPVVAGAGDIACDPYTPFFNDGYGTAANCHALYTSDELLRMDLNSVLMLGDAQYEDGNGGKFALSYDPSWGRLKPITHPVIGNHEYYEPTAAGYFDYFDGPGNLNGPAGARGQGWYSFDVGAWHVVALNSNCDQIDCSPGSPEESWLRADLAAHHNVCTLAIMHHPLTPPGIADDGTETTPPIQPLWQALYDAHADLVLVGHRHVYERVAPLDPQAQVDPTNGIRMIVAGTGGKNLQPPGETQPGSEVREGTSFGVVRLTLHATSYDWQFVPDTAGGYTDAGSGACH
jgi:acid phosphatase type 7